MTTYVTRHLDALIADLMAQVPALLVVGPRATGKTTTAKRHANTFVRLDREAEAAAFRADPDVALAAAEKPVLLDEWQVVPEVLGAVKRAVDEDPTAGQFLLTGSVHDDLAAETWPGTGRVIRLPLYGMTIREQLGRLDHPPFLDRIAADMPMKDPVDPPDLRGYIDLALQSGFPRAVLHLDATTRQRWLESYIDQLLTRDVKRVSPRRDPQRLGRYFEACALHSAGVVEDSALLLASGVNRKTATAYEHLLRNLMVIEQVPAWTTNRIKRLTRAGKRYLVDPAFLGAALRLDAPAVLRDGDLLGRILDTFVAAQLRAEIVVSQDRPRLFHLRQEQGRHEIDLIVELGGQRVIGIEIKASASPGSSSARHLAWLRESLGERFIAGIVFHTGPRPYSLGDRITAVPICSLWATEPRQSK